MPSYNILGANDDNQARSRSQFAAGQNMYSGPPIPTGGNNVNQYAASGGYTNNTSNSNAPSGKAIHNMSNLQGGGGWVATQDASGFTRYANTNDGTYAQFSKSVW